MSLIPKRGTVYIVDDDDAVRDSVQWLLEGQDFRVRCFESAEAFLARYDPRDVACLIVDIRMEGKSGFDVAAYLREVAARTEQYWCPIKYARRIKGAHERYPRFFDYGDAEAFRQGLNRLRRQYDE